MLHYYNNDTRRQSPYWYDYHYITGSENPYITYWPINKFKWHYYDNEGKEIAYIDALFNISNYNYTYTVYKVYNDLEVPVSEIITDEDEIKDLINKSVRCELDESCSVLNNSNSYFITRCILNILSKSSAPNRDQEFTPKESVYNLEITYFDEEQYDLYCIPQLFTGNHTVEISVEGMETNRRNIYIDSSGMSFSLTEMYCISA